MDKKTLETLAVKKERRESYVLSVRIDKKVMEVLKKRNIDVAKTVQSVLERLAE